YEAGVQVAAPRWIGRIGFEWLFRLAVDPRRLFRRYCVEPWSLVRLAAQDIMAARRANRLFKRAAPSPAESSRGAAV
ncbi:WecB/TagA/CpsF family glycosyltransferase, partial [Phenylobacterium sp.]|uniref:WecB/TagA/CpsF family glycosyltransferase n=1 Tax=Phenylobacterium sp. TaxID=1871053 RepID=UPI00286CF295